MAHTADAVIIGAGIIGTATAFEMAKAGYRTLTVDRNREAGHGSTSGSCAIIRVHYSTLEGTAFAWEGYHYWRDWAEYLGVADERGLAEFRETGCMVMKTNENDYLKKHAANCDALSIPYHHWGPDDIARHLPLYDLSRFFPPKRPEDDGFGETTGGGLDGAIHFPTAGYISDPALASHNLMRAAEAAGAAFLLGRTVTETLRTGSRVSGVRLDNGEEIHAPVVVNIAGPASRQVNEMAGVTGDMTITTRALRQEVTHLPAPDGYYAEPGGLVVSDSDIACYTRPEQGGNLLIGSEDPPCDPKEWIADDTEYDRQFTEQWRIQALRQAQRVPSLGIPSRMRGVVDLYDVTEDWIPIYDRSQLDGFYMACGSSGNQFKNAPIAGKLMTGLIQYCEAGNDHDARPYEFRMPYTGRQCHATFYSRKREINRESSFSVLG
jgi:glycine/D-amino acid oxidase-like deaminating enzyme